MCVGSELVNLCACGHAEIEHDEPSVLEHMLDAELGWWGTPVRGRCRGRHLDGLDSSQPNLPPTFQACPCQQFHSLFSPTWKGLGE